MDFLPHPPCVECIHHRKKLVANPFPAGSPMTKGVLEARKKWEEYLDDIHNRELDTRNRDEDFLVEPTSFSWCHHYTEQRLSVDPVSGETTRIYALCERWNFEGDCPDFRSADEHACPRCQAVIDATARFCTGCGFQLRCARCEARLRPGLRFCTQCGEKVARAGRNDASVERIPHVASPATCKDCQHFRTAVPVSEALKSRIDAGMSSLQQGLQKVQDQEMETLDKEAMDKVTIMTQGSHRWPYKPSMWSFCAERGDNQAWFRYAGEPQHKGRVGVFEICEQKNRDRQCPSFRPGPRPLVNCYTCRYCALRVEREPSPESSGKPEIYWEKQKNFFETWASELTQVFYHRGKLPSIRFHDRCRYLDMALPYPNLHADCRYYERRADLTGALPALEE